MATRKVNGAAVRALREALGITQTDLAARCSITQGALSHIENGTYSGAAPLGRRLATALGVSMDAITHPVPEPEHAKAAS